MRIECIDTLKCIKKYLYTKKTCLVLLYETINKSRVMTKLNK